MMPSAPPEAALTLFGGHLPLVESYVALLASVGAEHGLIGPKEVPRLWDRHILNCAVIEALVERGAAVADVGSGAGLPGVPLAIVRPDLSVTLVESLLRRTNFLEHVVSTLGLSNVEVLRDRAENVGETRSFDAVTARAVAPLDRLVKWTLPMVRPGGRLLAIKGESVADELAVAEPALRKAGATAWYIAEVGSGIVSPATTVLVVER